MKIVLFFLVLILCTKEFVWKIFLIIDYSFFNESIYVGTEQTESLDVETDFNMRV